MYTQVLRCLSSKGYIVVALEHEDGSGSFATRAGTGETILYTQPPRGMPYTRETVPAFRKPFLQHRVNEITGVWAKNIGTRLHNQGVSNDGKTLVSEGGEEGGASSYSVDGPEDLLARFGDPSKVSLVGHSFGAATMALVSQHLAAAAGAAEAAGTTATGDVTGGATGGGGVGSKQVLGAPECVVLWDPWAFPLEDSALAAGVGGGGNGGSSQACALSVLSEAWLTGNELPQIRALLTATKKQGGGIGGGVGGEGKEDGSDAAAVASYYLPGTTHMSFSDTALCFPSFMAERLRMMGPNENCAQTHLSLAKTAHLAITAAREVHSGAVAVGGGTTIGGGGGSGSFPDIFQKRLVAIGNGVPPLLPFSPTEN
jgi:hypothetical protein